MTDSTRFKNSGGVGQVNTSGNEDWPQQVVGEIVCTRYVQRVNTVGLDVVAASIGVRAKLVVLALLQRL